MNAHANSVRLTSKREVMFNVFSKLSKTWNSLSLKRDKVLRKASALICELFVTFFEYMVDSKIFRYLGGGTLQK